jgi:sulfite reductase (NADPH) flavoprotein alpha-component
MMGESLLPFLAMEPAPLAAAVAFSRKNPFPGTLLVSRSLSSPDIDKDTRHYEIGIKGSGLSYEVGDSLGVFPQNDTELVNDILGALGCSGDEVVPSADGDPMTLRKRLTSENQITHLDKKIVEAFALKVGDQDLQAMATDPVRKDAFEQYKYGREVIDLLIEYPEAKFTPEEFVSLLRKLQPRLYSIASSQKIHPDEVHLCIVKVTYKSNGRHRKGVASTWFADRVGVQKMPIPVFVHVAKHFRLPEDPNTPIIMVGPGTGIAPFRAFLEERRSIGAKGKAWLFFGSQRRTGDFLYGDELENYAANGALTKFSTAFSRDQDHKIYVQHRMLENGAEIWKWLEEGAYFYVCGDAKRMAKDVDEALHKIIESVGGKSPEDAQAYVTALRNAKRIRRDVY